MPCGAQPLHCRWSGLLMLTVAALLLPGQESCDEPPIDPSPSPLPEPARRIMPLGDSLTDGFNVPGGYRIELDALLLDAGWDFQFVGSLQNGPPELSDRDHEGHNGWRIDQIASEVEGWIAVERPDDVLLMIGTNDVLQDYALEQAPERLDRLVEQLERVMPAGRVWISSIPPLASSADEAQARQYNAAISELIEIRMQAGEPVHWVDGYAALTVLDLADGIHLTRRGYDTLGTVWATTLLDWE